ncbi:hypothetical protein C5S53_03505, partial [Methanophagales archaeon]
MDKPVKRKELKEIVIRYNIAEKKNSPSSGVSEKRKEPCAICGRRLIGLLRWRIGMKRQDIRAFLGTKGITLSTGTISNR